MRKRICRMIVEYGLLGLVLGASARIGLGQGDTVAVVYNEDGGPGSRSVARHYARERQVPESHLIGLRLPKVETISRADFDAKLRAPLVKALQERGLVDFRKSIVPAQPGRPGQVVNEIVGSRIRYLVLCHGVPLRIARDVDHVDAGQERMPEALRRNEAAVDSELAYLPWLERGAAITGPGRNLHLNSTNATSMGPVNGLFMVARLDGPTVDIARALVDRALQGERRGLWGRGWFDARGLNSGNYKLGDDWIREAAKVTSEAGFETVLDEAAAVFPPGFPMPHIAIYCGWYTATVSGPFAAEEVEFMPGAIAYHLHSFSATTIRNAKARWVGPLLAKGAAATLGSVFEPYLGATPNLGILMDRLINHGFTFGEAAYASQNALSWQVTVVGDPLYRPFRKPLDRRRDDLAVVMDPLLPWAELQKLNVELGKSATPSALVEGLRGIRSLETSSVLQQKLAESLAAAGRPLDAIGAYRRALGLKTSEEQRAHLQLALARLLAANNLHLESVRAFDEFFKEQRKRPGLLPIYEEALPVAKAASDEAAGRRYSDEIRRLTPPPPSPEKEETGAKSQ